MKVRKKDRKIAKWCKVKGKWRIELSRKREEV
jgi:hypothetical protein